VHLLRPKRSRRRQRTRRQRMTRKNLLHLRQLGPKAQHQKPHLQNQKAKNRHQDRAVGQVAKRYLCSRIDFLSNVEGSTALMSGIGYRLNRLWQIEINFDAISRIVPLLALPVRQGGIPSLEPGFFNFRPNHSGTNNIFGYKADSTIQALDYFQRV
jgi:hypothetical protein